MISTFGTENPGGIFTYQAQKLDGTQDAGNGHLEVPLVSTMPEPSEMSFLFATLIGFGTFRRKFAQVFGSVRS